MFCHVLENKGRIQSSIIWATGSSTGRSPGATPGRANFFMTLRFLICMNLRSWLPLMKLKVSASFFQTSYASLSNCQYIGLKEAINSCQFPSMSLKAKRSKKNDCFIPVKFLLSSVEKIGHVQLFSKLQSSSYILPQDQHQSKT